MPNKPYVITYRDALDHARRYIRGGGESKAEEEIFAAVQSAYEAVCHTSQWNYHWSRFRFQTNAAQTDGTVVYDHTGGAYERMLTITSSTWPDWTVYGEVRIGNNNYRVASKESSTILTLAADSNPGTDVASTTYKLFRSTYPFPIDFKKTTLPNREQWGGMRYVTPEEFHYYEQQFGETGDPTIYTIAGDDSLIGQAGLRMYPAASSSQEISGYYIRYPRQLRVSGENTADGTGTVTTGGVTTAVTGNSTQFDTNNHPGCIIRFGDASYQPSGRWGRIRPADERVITAVTSTTALTTDAVVSALSAVKYIISDPVDLDQAICEYFYREIERQMCLAQRDYKNLSVIRYEVERAKNNALMVDNKRAGEDTMFETVLTGDGWSDFASVSY